MGAAPASLRFAAAPGGAVRAAVVSAPSAAGRRLRRVPRPVNGRSERTETPRGVPGDLDEPVGSRPAAPPAPWAPRGTAGPGPAPARSACMAASPQSDGGARAGAVLKSTGSGPRHLASEPRLGDIHTASSRWPRSPGSPHPGHVKCRDVRLAGRCECGALCQLGAELRGRHTQGLRLASSGRHAQANWHTAEPQRECLSPAPVCGGRGPPALRLWC